MLISLTGPSGVGKGYVKERLLETYPSLQEVTWSTTRELRPNELEHRGNREHVSMKEFKSLESASELLFVQNVYSQWYGIRKNGPWFLNQGHWITEFHIENLLEALKNSVKPIAFAIVPNHIEFLRQRLDLRRTERVEQIEARLSQAEKEIERILDFQHLFSNIFTVSVENEDCISDFFTESVRSYFRKE